MISIDIIDDIVNQFCIVIVMLIQYFYYLRFLSLIFKKILEILYNVLFILSLVLFIYENKDSKLYKILRSFLVFFLSVVECCFFVRIFRNFLGIVGFSGIEIKSYLGFIGQIERIDLLVLRKVLLMVFKFVFIVLKLVVQQEGMYRFEW